MKDIPRSGQTLKIRPLLSAHPTHAYIVSLPFPPPPPPTPSPQRGYTYDISHRFCGHLVVLRYFLGQYTSLPWAEYKIDRVHLMAESGIMRSLAMYESKPEQMYTNNTIVAASMCLGYLVALNTCTANIFLSNCMHLNLF